MGMDRCNLNYVETENGVYGNLEYHYKFRATICGMYLPAKYTAIAL